jgi:hypothetical protein
MVGGGATAVVAVLDAACSAAGPLLHAAAATVRIATPTAPTPTRTAFDPTRFSYVKPLPVGKRFGGFDGRCAGG